MNARLAPGSCLKRLLVRFPLLATVMALTSLVIAVPFSGVASAQAMTTLYASPTGTGDYCSVGSACSLEEAIAQAEGTSGPVVIELEAGDYYSSSNVNIDDSEPSSSLTLEGPTGQQAVLCGPTNCSGASGSAPVLTVAGTTPVTLENLTIEGGDNSSSSGGGGILNNGNLNLYNSTVSNNRDGSSTKGGGGILNNGTLSVIDSTVSYNVVSNKVQNGGGIQNLGTLSILDSTISNNSAGGSGGGICNQNTGSLKLEDSTVYKNHAINSVGAGGGLCNYGGQAVVEQSTIVDNTDTYEGGGIYNGNSGTLKLAGSIIAENSPQDCINNASLTDDGYNVEGKSGGCGFSSSSSVKSSSIDSYLGVLANNGGPTETIAIVASVDDPAYQGIPSSFDLPVPVGGVSLACQVPDQRGFPRSSPCDIGAYEVSLAPAPAAQISSVSPLAGPVTGRTTVVIMGSSFSSQAEVYFSNQPATRTIFVSPEELEAITPPHVSGKVSISVEQDGAITTSQATFSYQAAFVAIPSVRICDTRQGNPSNLSGPYAQCNGHSLVPNKPLDITVAGLGGVPASGVSAVALNITVTQAKGPGYLVVYPYGQAVPATSNINFQAGQTIANQVEAPLGLNDQIAILSSASADVVVDIEGYYSVEPAPGEGRYVPISPVRICDTRSGNPSGLYGQQTQCNDHPLTANTPFGIEVAGIAPVPSSIEAVVLEVSALGYQGPGYLSIYPSPKVPEVSSLNFSVGQGPVDNTVIVPVNSSGDVYLYSDTQTNVLVEVVGYFTAASSSPETAGQFNALSFPQRILDTRCGGSTTPPFCSRENLPSPNSSLSSLVGGQRIDVKVAGIDGIPSNATAVVVNLTVTDTSSSGYLSVNPSRVPPNTSELNWLAGQTKSVMVIAKVSSSGTIEIYNYQGTVDLLVDVLGWYQVG